MLTTQSIQRQAALSGPARARVLVTLASSLSRFSKELHGLSADDAGALATLIEHAVLILSKSDATLYTSIAERVCYNIHTSGPHIIGRIPLYIMCTASHKQLMKHTKRAQRHETIEREVAALTERAKVAKRVAKAQAQSIHTGAALRCPKCGSQDRITRVLSQMNAGDEGMKTRCWCNHCNHRWNIA